MDTVRVGQRRGARSVVEPSPLDRELGTFAGAEPGWTHPMLFLERALEMSKVCVAATQLVRAHLEKICRGRTAVPTNDHAIEEHGKPGPPQPVEHCRPGE